MSGTAQRLKHAARIESQKHGHFLTLFRRGQVFTDHWFANCVKCGGSVTVDVVGKSALLLTTQCDEGRLK